ncbi:TY-Chap domain-containing protein [Thermomonospora amylolytica]|uniref:TY-Chap domain-containing protein n=1 Tax=Thermomonospora amylolytica TaxID=1411117 RepID=UPI000E6CC119|nr:SseB family protein [Thermomonospora amylolytica]
MDWNEFAQRLTRELMHLPVDAYVVVQGFDGLPYVQAMRYQSGLHAEAVSSDYLPEPLSPRQELLLSELGWLTPDGHKRRNWWCRVMLPAEPADITREQAAECRALAERMVAAFRDVYGVPSVADLCYEADRDGEHPGPLPMPGLGVPRAGQEPAPAAPAPPEWAMFAERLACELAAMQPQMGLVVSQRLQESYYVQAFRDARGVHAEAVSGQALPPHTPVFDAAQEERLAAVGWRWPGDHPNWTFDLPAGAEPDEFRRLAEMMVVALREVHLARGPDDLVYEAFIGPSYVELTELGIPPADPGRVEIRKTSPSLPAAGAGAPPGSGRHADPEIEAALVAAKSRGDQGGYLNIVLRAQLYVPVAPDGRHLTADYRDGTYILAFTSPDAMDWALGGPLMDYRRTTFAELACEWPDPAWRLAINTRLPSSAYIDTDTIRRVAEHARSGRPPASTPPMSAPTAPAHTPPGQAPGSRPGDLSTPEQTDHGNVAADQGLRTPPAADPLAERRARPGDAGTGGPSATAATDLPVAGKAARRHDTGPARRPIDGPTPRAEPGGRPTAAQTDLPVAGKAARSATAPGQAVPPTGVPGTGPQASPGGTGSGGQPTGAGKATRPTTPDPGQAVPPADLPGTGPQTSPRGTGSGGQSMTPVAGKAARSTADRGQAVPSADLPGTGPQASPGGTGGGRPATPGAGEGARSAAADLPNGGGRSVASAADLPVAGKAVRRGGAEPARAGSGGAAVDLEHGPAGGLGGETSVPVGYAEAPQIEVETVRPLRDGEVVQKVVRPDHVAHYLDGGYDWVAGAVNRLQDVSGLRTPEQVVRALGLERPGSPFSAGDDEVHVIRWPLIRPALVRAVPGTVVPTFRIGSRRLPHGAEMFRLDRAGTETFLAVYDADLRAWLRTAEVDG